MKIIAHRANLDTLNKELENDPIQIQRCIDLGFDVEIDVWKIQNKFFLGHDEPQYEISYKFLENENLWCHAKNYNAAESLIDNSKIHSFWHQNDDYTITSKRFIWVYPGKILPLNSVAVMPEKSNYSIDELKNCYAICTDKPFYYKKLLGD